MRISSTVRGSTSFIIEMSGIIRVTCPVGVLVYRLVISNYGIYFFIEWDFWMSW